MSVTAIHRYPVKSMLGESLERCRVGRGGIPGDRAYALVDVETGTVASAKVPRRWAALLDFSARYLVEPEPDSAPPDVEITFPDGSVHTSADADIDAALSAVVGRAVHLTSKRPEDGSFEELWPEIDGLAPEGLIGGTTTRTEVSGEPISSFAIAMMAQESTAFFDLATVHVLTESTLAQLRALAPSATFDVQRYRPNFVLDDAGDGFAENTWMGRTLTIGATRVSVSIPTMRCVMTTLAQGDLPRDAETLRTIAKHNRIEIPEMGKWACAGVYGEVETPGEVGVGNPHHLT
ncbi:MOSC domain-containing protein [Pseudonocardia sp. TRM90224]|uniref:MOSC domain-containing protein n=1 Tax=Pseudonocardia sp. TRM90224 TaxID=2812678 RepID=UPI001E426042|nr:MOSC N-terminal beta barrel domain-containing protein [Pseudonocardia sp. TRM90224]